MDAADGVLGGRTVERRLEIMRESQVGAFGATAGILVILSQFACLTELTGADRFVALVAVFATSRWAMTLALVGFPPARADGLGATLQAGSGDASLAIGTLFALLFALVTSPLGAVIFAGGALVTLVGGYLLTRSLGGLTGDTYGALAVLVETLGLYLAVAILTGGTGS
jgi:adenosylcobinamide-GDP ribazoletransferase